MTNDATEGCRIERIWREPPPDEPKWQFYVGVFSEQITINEHGKIVTRIGTGGNLEITYFRVHETRKGHGRRLLQAALRLTRNSPPYHTVYGFTRTCNTDAHRAYEALGFTLSTVTGVYKDGTAVVFSASYADLCARHLKDDDA